MDRDREFKKILVIHFGQLGDVVLGLPALRSIREHFAEASITLMVGKATADIARLANVADDHIVVDRVAMRDGNKLWTLGEIVSLVQDVRRRKFDFVIDLHSLYETNLLGFFAGVPTRLYAQRENRSLDRLSNFRPRPPIEDKAVHVTRRYLDVLAPLDITGPAPQVVLTPSSEDAAAVDSRFSGLEGAIGLFPGAGHESRKWPLENFAAVARHIVDRGRRPAVFLGPEESGLETEIAQVFPPETRVVSGLTLPQLAAAISGLALFACNDSGPAHIAASVGTPVVLVMGKEAPLIYLPFSDNLRVVNTASIAQIPVAAVTSALDDLAGRE